MRLIQISDTHHSVEHKDFASNCDVIGAAVAAHKPDLIINTGDIAMNGCICAPDFELARSWHQALGVPVLCVPGNHDVGDRPEIRVDQVIDDARINVFKAYAGADRWTHDSPGWRFIGLNAMLFKTGHAQEEAQFEWLREAVETDAKLAIFMHKPLFIDSIDEGARGYWTVYPEPRRRLLDIIASRDVRLVASGHLHIARELTVGNTTHIWGPASSFVSGDSQEDLGGERRIGFVEYNFDETGFSHAFVFPEGAEPLLIDEVGSRIYPKPASKPA